MYQTYPIGQLSYPQIPLSSYLQNFWGSFINFFANIILALIIIIVGFLVAYVVDYLIRWVIIKLKINEGLEQIGFNKWAERANIKIEVDKFLGKVMFWVVWVLFWMMACDILGLSSFNQFISSVLRFLPNIIVAGLITVGAFFLGDFLKKVFYGIIKGAGAKGAEIGSEIVYYSTIIFGIGMALYQLGVAREIINLIIGGIVLAGALAIGLAFGLGGQEKASELIDMLKKKFS